jgi:hypothetical protein
MVFTVYALSDTDGIVRYVGATSASLATRLFWHVNSARPRARWSPPVVVWIRQLIADKRKPQITVIAWSRDLQQAAAIESAQIAHFRSEGVPLLNVRATGYIPGFRHRLAITSGLRDRGARRWHSRAANS